MHWIYTDPYDNNAAAVAVALVAFTTFIIFALIGYVIFSFFLMKIFDKAGVQGKWRAWVPVYNTLIFAKLGDLSPWWLLSLWGASIVLGLLPFIGPVLAWLAGVAAFVYTLLAAWRVGLKLQKEVPWLILYFFLAIVWYGINAFDKSRWNPNIAPAPWATNFLADKTVWAGVPVQPTAAVAGPGAPSGYAPPQGYEAPPAAYPPPPAGYTPPVAEPPSFDPPAGPDAPRS